MRREALRIVVLSLLGVLVFAFIGAAHPTQDEHDKEIKLVLFGNADHVFFEKEERNVFKAIADATALCIDQFSPNTTAHYKEKEFQDLKDRVGLSVDFGDIDLCEGINGASVTANTHRRYTHLGWNHGAYPLPELWETRKQLLIDTIQKEFFETPGIPIISDIPIVSDWFEDDSPDKRCDALGELLYCVHILGDHLEADKYNKVSALEPLVRINDAKEPGIILDLLSACKILFSDQIDSYTYIYFEQQMEKEYEKARKLMRTTGQINTDEKFIEYEKCSENVLDIMSNTIPQLLQRETFFREVFPE